jgi:hypothetical protein
MVEPLEQPRIKQGKRNNLRVKLDAGAFTKKTSQAVVGDEDHRRALRKSRASSHEQKHSQR